MRRLTPHPTSRSGKLPEHLPADLIAVWLSVSPRTVRRWAKEDGWRTVGRWPHLRYNIDDAAASMATRRGTLVL